MKINLNHSTKRALSLVLAFAVALGSLFTANVGINITTDAATTGTTVTVGKILTWDGTTEQPSADENGVYIIDSAEKLAWVSQSSGSGNADKTYKVADDISAFVMQNYDQATAKELIALDSYTDVKSWFDTHGTPTPWSGGKFYANLDGNGATIYGIYCTATEAGLFSVLNGGAAVKNLGIMNSYIDEANFAGMLAGRGDWNGGGASFTIENCAILNNYLRATGTNAQVGVMIGNAAGNAVCVKNCLVAENQLISNPKGTSGDTVLTSKDNKLVYTTNTTTNNIVENSIIIDAYPTIGSLGNTTFTNCYSTEGALDGLSGTTIQISSSTSLKGVYVQDNLTADCFVWAGKNDTAHGKWYIRESNYPIPYHPCDWIYVEKAAVWSGNTADFTKGGGTENDPYIIENPDQLYKMVKDGGKKQINTKKVTVDGVETTVPVYEPAYYKVADGVTDLYLNAVQGGTLDTLKGLVTAGSANDWTKGFDPFTNATADVDGDGYADEDAAFIGVFDGNGVTIHGLYSTNLNNVSDVWSSCYGVGFVPALTGNAIIKNVSFDKSYIYTNMYYAAVLTTSFGLDNDGTETATHNGETKIKIESNYYGKCYVSVYNVAVRNAYIEATSIHSTSYNGSCAGIVASHSNPQKAVFVNCLFDGYSSELVHHRPDYDHRGGIFSCTSGGGEYHLFNCVSLGYSPMPNDTSVGFNNLANADKVSFTDVYTDITDQIGTAVIDTIGTKAEYSKSDMPALDWLQWSLVEVSDGLSAFSGAASRTIPMPTGITSCNIAGKPSYKDVILSQVNGNGNFTFVGANIKGQYGQYHKLIGSGTAEDPYLISTAHQLATAISSGGIYINQELYYKLTNDIDLNDLRWIDADAGEPTTESNENGYWSDVNKTPDDSTDDVWVCRYSYVPFVGTLDGNGYAVYGLNAADGGALIPELNGGTVKNLHIRNSSVSTAVIAASATDATIDGCSAENCIVASGKTLVGTSTDTTITNSYCDDTYYLESGDTGTPTADGVIWYQGGADGCTPKLVNRAMAMSCADIDGDGVGFEYTPADLTALKSRLLKKSAYACAYGDVTKDGKVNSADLAILSRMVTEDYNHVKDGFWRNLALGRISIHYGENDNYDAARKLELYLEAAVPGLDVQKVVSAEKFAWGEASDKSAVYVHNGNIALSGGKTLVADNSATDGYREITDETKVTKYALDGKLEIVVGNIANYDAYATNTVATGDNTYAITYDKENGVLWLQGKNFTAVEQAVLDFINKSDFASNTVYTVGSTSLSTEKIPVTLPDGSVYYYAWGDEFGTDAEENSILKTQVNEDNWIYSKMGTETVSGEPKYENLETAFNEDFSKLYVVKDGKLSIKRGVYGGSSSSDWGYVNLGAQKTGTNAVGDVVETGDTYVSAGHIDGQNSLLVKQGYFEFKASLPSDGHSFMSWWMLGDPSGGNNNGYTESLYSKVYKLNPNYDGKTNVLDSSNAATTYKYQLPNSTFEIDIIELMQDISCLTDMDYYTNLEKIYEYELPLNLHKFFTTGVTADNKYYLNTWNADGTVTRGNSYTVNKNDTNSDSKNLTDGIFSCERPAKHDFGNQTGYVYNAAAQKKLIATRRYGFEWKVTSNDNGVGQSFEYTLYIWDPDGDGEANANDYKKYSFTDIEYNEEDHTTYNNLVELDGKLSDAEIANQYMHFLIDNTYYTANQHYWDGVSVVTEFEVKQFTDLLKQTNALDKTTLDIEYMRVYQADGRRDIVTAETEAFNNGNHFGY